MACLGGENLIPGGNFDTKLEPKYLSGDSYSVNLIRRGWDFKRIGPLFWGMPVFTPNGGTARVRQEEGTGAYEGSGCLLMETTDKDCSAYIGSIFSPGLNYTLTFAAKGQGEINFGAYVYRDNKMIEAPTFITVTLTDTWKTYTVAAALTNPEAHIGGLVLNVKPKTCLYLDSLSLERQ